MKDMTSFAKQQIDEAAKQVEPSDEKVVVNGKVTDKDKALDAGEKPNAAKKMKWAVDEPTDNDAAKFANKDDWDTNMKMLRSRIRANKPFFILGHAGWGKTQVIKAMAKKFGLSIITVYLDKAVPEDLEGIPVPMEGEKGSVYQERAMPAWAAYIIENPNKKFLLFFDEMNQADPRVMNALMPIVQENTIGGYHIPNYIVGAAGNYKDENAAVSKLSEPLMERFAPIIQWDDNTPEAWSHNFRTFQHPTWDGRLGKDFVNEFEKNSALFRSPRVVDQKLFEFLWEIKQLGEDEWDFYDPDFYLKYMQGEGILVDNLSQSEKKDVEKLAEYIDAWMREDNESAKANNRSREILDAPQWLKEEIKYGMEKGWIAGDNYKVDHIKYAFSRDLLPYLFVMDGPEPITMEQIEQEVSKNEKKGIHFKYEKAKDAIADGYEVEPETRKALGL